METQTRGRAPERSSPRIPAPPLHLPPGLLRRPLPPPPSPMPSLQVSPLGLTQLSPVLPLAVQDRSAAAPPCGHRAEGGRPERPLGFSPETSPGSPWVPSRGTGLCTQGKPPSSVKSSV